MSFVPPVPPVPAAQLPFLSFLRAVRSNALRIWPTEAYERETVVHSTLGRKRILLNRADAIQHVLLTNTGNYRRSPASIRILRPILGDGLLLAEGDAWRLQRRTIAPALGPRAMPVLARHVAEATGEAVADLHALTEASPGAPVDLMAAVQRLALEVAGRSMFSLETREHGETLRRMLMTYGEKLGRPFLLDLFVPTRIKTPHDYARLRFRAEWMAFMDRLMAPRLSEPEPAAPRDLFDMLRAARDPDTGAAFSREALRDQTVTMILAGHETTAVTLFWALYLLASDPAAQDWVAQEATVADLSTDGAWAGLGALARTRAVVNETLRLYPAAFTLVRQAVGPDDAGGVAIPAGALVFISPWVLHRHRGLWDDPERFLPDRFLGPAPSRYSYLPFGAGPRVCVGMQFALTEATIMLASIIQSFSIEVAGARPVLPRTFVTTVPDHAPGFRLRPRGATASARPNRMRRVDA